MKTIAWDVDDTLNDFTRIWLENWWGPRYRSSALNYAELIELPSTRLLCMSDSEYVASLDEFRLSEDSAKINAVAPVLDWFQEHGENARHIALTATSMLGAPLSAAWVMQHYGKWIRSYNVLPSSRPGVRIPVYDRNKAEFLQWFGKVDVLVEDSALHLQSANEAGFATIAVPQPWNNYEGTIWDALSDLTALIQE